MDQYLTRILHVTYPAPGDPEGRRSAQDLFERGKRITHLHTKLIPTKHHYQQLRRNSRGS